MALSAALLGWMFDGAEMGVFSLVGRQAVIDLPGSQTPVWEPLTGNSVSRPAEAQP
jgi:hypothetical protein